MTLVLKINGQTVAQVPEDQIHGIRFTREDGSLTSISECAVMLERNAKTKIGPFAQWFYSDDVFGISNNGAT